MSRPTLSIILTNYNDSAHLPHAIEALHRDEACFCEVVAVDDGSTDHSVSLLHQLSQRYPKLRLVKHEHNRGVLAAFNTGLQHARGQWVYGAAADDVVLPGFLSEAMRWAHSHPSAGLIFGRVDCVDRAGKTVDRLAVPAWSDSGYRSPQRFLEDHLDQDPAGACFSAATLYRLDALQQIGGFREDLALLSDLFTARALGLTHGIIYLDQPCVRWTYDPNSFSVKQSLDPAVTEPLGQAMLAAMSEPGMQHLFPSQHRRRWALRWQLEMVGGYDLLRDALVPNRLRDVRRAYAQWGLQGRWFDRLLTTPLRSAFALADARRRSRDEAYQPPHAPVPAPTPAKAATTNPASA